MEFPRALFLLYENNVHHSLILCAGTSMTDYEEVKSVSFFADTDTTPSLCPRYTCSTLTGKASPPVNPMPGRTSMS